MKKFQFPLEAAMSWRERTAERERSSLQQLFGAHSDLNLQREAVARELRTSNSPSSHVTSTDLHLMAAHRNSLLTQHQLIVDRQHQCETRISSQRQKCIQADREHKLVAKLRESHWSAWQSEMNRELQESANESFLAGWVRNKL